MIAGVHMSLQLFSKLSIARRPAPVKRRNICFSRAGGLCPVLCHLEFRGKGVWSSQDQHLHGSRDYGDHLCGNLRGENPPPGGRGNPSHPGRALPLRKQTVWGKRRKAGLTCLPFTRLRPHCFPSPGLPPQPPRRDRRPHPGHWPRNRSNPALTSRPGPPPDFSLPR